MERPPPPLTPRAVLRPERVALVEDAAGHRLVLKRIPRRHLEEPEALRAMAFEGRALERLGGPPAPILIDRGTDARGPWILLSYLPEPALADRAFTDAAAAFDAALDALAVVHARGVIHGDPSPDNVRVAGGTARLLDFDLGRFPEEPAPPIGVARGTLAVVAPALLRGEPPTEATDRYALAASFAATLLGAPLRDLRGGPAAIVGRGGDDDLRPLAALGPLGARLAEHLRAA